MKENIIKSPFTILFVDDEDNARKYFEKGMKHDFSVMTAANVEEAKKIITENHQNIGVVVTDQRMPGGNGVILLKFLKENYPHIIRLLTTAYSDLSEAIEAVNNGEIFRYVQKPWDYNLLKTELHQAIELFELRFERNQMLHEKIMIKKKMTKIERVKILLLFTNIFKFLNNSNVATQSFIKQFANNAQDSSTEENWESFDFGKQDVLEAKFLMDLLNKVQTEISSATNYNLDKTANSDEIKSIITEVAGNINSTTSVNISEQTQIKINQNSFSTIIKKLLEIASLSQASTSFTLSKIDNGAAININIEPFTLAENENIFITSPDKNATTSYVNLLICYLLVAHHGGSIDVADNNNRLELIIKLPNDPAQSAFLNKAGLEEVENVILGTMLS